MSNKEYQTVSGYVDKITEKAILLFVDDDPDKKQWIPLSVMESPDDVDEGDIYDFNVEIWFCEKEGL